MLCVCFLPDTLCRFFHVVYGHHLWEFRILYVPYISYVYQQVVGA